MRHSLKMEMRVQIPLRAFMKEKKKFPGIFDTLYDIKSERDAIKHLKRLKEQYNRSRQDYNNLYRLLREHGYKLDLPSSIEG